MRGLLAITSRSKKTILYRLFLLSLFTFVFYYVDINTPFGVNESLEYYSINTIIDFNNLASIVEYNIDLLGEHSFSPILFLILFALAFSLLSILFISISSVLDIVFIVMNYGKNLDFFENNDVKIESKYTDDLNKVKTGDILKYPESLRNLNHIRKKIKEMKTEDNNFFLTKNEIKLKRSRDELRDYENISYKIIQHVDNKNT